MNFPFLCSFKNKQNLLESELMTKALDKVMIEQSSFWRWHLTHFLLLLGDKNNFLTILTILPHSSEDGANWGTDFSKGYTSSSIFLFHFKCLSHGRYHIHLCSFRHFIDFRIELISFSPLCTDVSFFSQITTTSQHLGGHFYLIFYLKKSLSMELSLLSDWIRIWQKIRQRQT